MQRPDTPDGLFHDGNPATGVKGTPLTAALLNQWLQATITLSGAADPPAAGLGGDNDFYISTVTGNLYGPKTAGVWGAPWIREFPWVEAKSYVTLADADAAAVAAGKNLLLSNEKAVTVDQTVLADVSAVKGGKFNISAGKVLSLSGQFSASRRQFFWGSGNVSFAISSITEVCPEWFGAVPDGVVDCTSAITRAITAAAGRVPVVLSPGTYKLAGFVIGISRTHLRGALDNFSDDIVAPSTIFKFISGAAGIDTTPSAAREVTIENIAIDGNNTITDGVKGGYYTRIINSTVNNCLGAGVFFPSSIYARLDRVRCNYNQDGIVLVDPGSIEIMDSTASANSRHGLKITGVGGTAFVSHLALEQNAGTALKIDASIINMAFSRLYFEVSTFAPEYFIEYANAGFQDQKTGVVFDVAYFASAGATLTKIGNFTSGRVKFRECSSLQADPSDMAMDVSSAAEVIIEDSFPRVTLPKNVHRVLSDAVNINKTHCFRVNSGYINGGGLTLTAPGTNDFAVNISISHLEDAATIRSVLSSAAAGGFGLLIIPGSAGFVVVTKYGTSTVAQIPAILPFGVAKVLTYSRLSGVGYLYCNGVLLSSFADVTDYDQEHSLIGAAQYNTFADIFSCSYWSAGLTAAQVFDLFRAGGNAEAAGLASGLLLNLRCDHRPGGKVYDSVSGTWLTMVGDVTWLSPSTPVYVPV